MFVGARLRDVALALAAITAFSVGFEHVRPTIAINDDLRLTNLRLLLLVTVAVWLVGCAVRRQWPRVPRAVALPLGLWLLALLASATLAPSFEMQALGFVRDLVLGVALGWAVYDLARTPARQRFVARALALCGMGVAVFGLAEAIHLQPIDDWLAGFRYQPSFNVGEVLRVTATLTHPNIAAMLLGLTIPLQLAWIVTSPSGWPRAVLGVGLAAELGTLVLTISRTGAAVVELVLGFMLLAGLMLRHRLLVQASAAGAVCLPLFMGGAIARQPILLLHLSGEAVQNWYRADYSTPGTVTAHAGEAALVPIRLENTGERVWSATGSYPFALSYHLVEADGTPVTYDGPRTTLPADVPPGASLEVQAKVLAPQTPGTYLVEWDEVQENVTWFSWAGSPTAVTYLKVGDPPVSSESQAVAFQPTQPPAAVAPPPAVRLDQWRTALYMLRQRPLLGVGPDNFRWVYGDFAGLPTWDTGGHANSVYFEFLADTGIVGFGLFLWMGWQLLRTTLRSVFVGPGSPLRTGAERIDQWWVWRLAFAAALCAWFLHGILDYFFEPLPTNLAFWLLAALGLAAAEALRLRDLEIAVCASPST